MAKTRKCQHRKALEVFPKVGATATPEDIDKHVGGTGSYYSKHMSVMRRWGFEFDVKKDGRNVLSYTLKKEPANASEYRTVAQSAPAKAPKAKKAVVKAPEKVAKPAKAKKAVEPKKTAKAPEKKVSVKDKTAETKAKNLEKLKSALAKVKEKKEQNIETPPKATSFSVDEDFDAVDELKVSDLL